MQIWINFVLNTLTYSVTWIVYYLFFFVKDMFLKDKGSLLYFFMVNVIALTLRLEAANKLFFIEFNLTLVDIRVKIVKT